MISLQSARPKCVRKVELERSGKFVICIICLQYSERKKNRGDKTEKSRR